MQLELRKIGSALQEAYAHQWKLRQEFLTYLAKKRQQEGLTTAKAIETIAREERLQHTYPRLRYARKGENHSRQSNCRYRQGVIRLKKCGTF